MIDAEKRKEFEQTAIEVVKDVYKHINPSMEVEVPTDTYSHWDLIATSNEKVYYVENKTRNISYKVYKDEGYYLDVNKVDGTIDIFNYYFPQDNILMITRYDKIKDLVPQDTLIHKDVFCDDESKPKVKSNVVIPYDRFWVVDTTDNTIINKPTK